VSYTPLFDPSSFVEPPVEAGTAVGDRRDGAVYHYDKEGKIALAVNVALATGRPLLVRGPSGCGKSSLARHVARVQGWRFYEQVISSRTQAQDLLWETDHLRRLQDAQTRRLRSGPEAYLRPGVLWWAFDRASALRQALRSRRPGTKGAADPGRGGPGPRAVVLLDEIDKADPDVPNNLLVPLGSLYFQVEETGQVVKADPAAAPFLVLTTNDERDLPDAFLRRCVELILETPPDAKGLADIGEKHFAGVSRERLEDIAGRVLGAAAGEVKPSPAEYLDAVRAWRRLGPDLGEEVWEDVLRVTVRKPGRTSGRAG
jgi:MoxR-like ATPase